MGLFDDDLSSPPPHRSFEAATEEEKQTRWENRVVTQILKTYGLERAASAIRQMNADDSRNLRFCHFKGLFPSFPVWLVCRKIPYVHKDLTPERMVHNWTKLKVFDEFVAAEADSPEDFQNGSGLGLVFEWLHVFPMSILSNSYYEGEESETVFKRTLRNVRPYQHMAIQSFSAFLTSLRWQPEAAT